jgi:hypothetical protein
MWTIIMQPGFANAIVDFTGVLSPLLVGLGGLMALSVGMIVALAIREQRAQTTPVVKPTPVEYREAA